MWGVLLDWEAILRKEGVKNVDKCMKWALGEDYATKSITFSNNLWNKRHGNLFILRDTDRVVDGLERIGRVYVEHMQEKEKEGVNESKG